MEKSRDAFRTISEVAEWLDVPTHVLRFWESRFSQIKPVKRAGGRRYYRPSDMRVIGGVKALLHDQGMTIRGVQKLFREKGIKHISSHSPALYGEDAAPETDASVVEHVSADANSATPAQAARSTHDAEPDPVVEHAAAEKAEEPVVEFTHGAAADKRIIEVPKGVPTSDPDDDDDAHKVDAGIAARLRSVPREHLAGHSDLVATAVQKLKALHERAD